MWDDLVLTPPSTPVTPTPSGTTGTLLVKAVSLSITDTLTEIYTYDTSKKLIKNATVGSSSGSKVDDSYTYTRNSSGNIVKIAEIYFSTASFNTNGYDTVLSVIHYPTGSNNFDYSITQKVLLGFVFNDSTVFAYTSGKITKQISYTTDLVSGAYTINNSIDYTYDTNGNVITAKAYSYATGSAVLTASYSFVYDSKKSPLMLGNESFIMQGPTSAGPNNFTQYNLIDPSSSLNNLAIAAVYNYNANSYPSDATITASRAGVSLITKSTLFYQ